MKDRDKEYWRSMYTLATVGINIVVATFIGLGMGWLLDHKFFPRFFHWESQPIFTLVFLVFGIIAGFRNLYSIVKEKSDAGKDKDSGEGDGS
jgi:ATP synthase protein I